MLPTVCVPHTDGMYLLMKLFNGVVFDVRDGLGKRKGWHLYITPLMS